MPTLIDILQYRLDLDTKGFTSNAGAADVAVNRLAGSIGNVLTGVVGGLATAFTAVKLGEFLKEATLTAARTEVLGTALNQVAKNAGIGRGEVTLLEEKIKSLGITTQETRTSIIRFIQSGLPLDRLAQLARLAQDAAVATEGLSSSEAFERLLRGIQTGQTELLRSAGIFISIEGSLKEFAKSADISRDSMTDLQRQTAILNAVLAQGDKLAGNYEAAMGDVGKQLTSQPRLWEELSNVIGTIFLPVLESVVDGRSRALKGLTSLLTPDAIENARKALSDGDVTQRQEALVALLEKRARITETIARNESLIAQLNLSAQASPLSGLNFLAADYAKGVTALLKRQLEDITNLVEGFRAKTLEGIPKILSPHQLDAAAQEEADARRERREEARAKRAKERADELAKTITIGGDLAEGMDKAWAKILDELEAIPLEFDYNKLDFDIKAIRDRIELGLAQSKLSPYGRTKDKEELFDIRGIQEDLQDAADKARESFERAFYGVGTIASAVLNGISREAGRVADNMLNIFASFSSGNIIGGIAGIIGTVFDFIGGSGGSQRNTSTAQLIRSQNALIDAINGWRESIINLSERDRAERLAAAQEALGIITTDRDGRRRGQNSNFDAELVRAILEGAGLDTASLGNNQLLEYVRQILEDLGAITVSGSAIVAATTAQSRQDLVNQARSAADANFLVRSFTELFDISQEEQLALLQSIIDRLGPTLSTTDFVAITTAIQELKNDIAGGGGPTQTERSIARVSERQADSLIAGLNTLDLHLVNGLTVISDYLQQMLALGQSMAAGVAGVAGGTYSIEVNNYFSGGNQSEIESTVSKAIEKGLRAVGGTRIGGR